MTKKHARKHLAALGAALALASPLAASASAAPEPTRLTDEELDDVTAGTLVEGPNVNVTFNDSTFTFYITDSSFNIAAVFQINRGNSVTQSASAVAIMSPTGTTAGAGGTTTGG